MGVERVFGGLMQNQRTQYSSQPFEALFSSGSSSSFVGSSSMVSFADVCGGKRSERPFFQTYDQDDNCDEDFDDYFHQPEKKRRLTVEQVRFLEKSFEAENKLEPERKVQLAKELGLQPRQVAIWFQNRRARWKTKQLERDYDALQASYNSLKAEYDSVLKEKEKLQAEVVHLTDKLNLKHKLQLDHCDSSNTQEQSKAATNQPEPAIDSASETEGAQVSALIPPKHEDLNSAKSDVLDSDSSHYYADVGGGVYSAIVDPAAGDSSYAFEADHSDISQDDEEYLISLMPPSNTFPTNSEYHVHTPVFWPCWDPNLKM